MYLKTTPTQVFSCEIYEIFKNAYFHENFKNAYFEEYMRATASG